MVPDDTHPTNLDRAHQGLAAASDGAISVAPIFRVANCGMYQGQPHMTAAGRAYVAELVGKHYAQER
jgi:hypothetical protein